MSLELLRQLAEAEMVDTATVREITGTSTDDDGKTAPILSAPIHSGPCKVQALDALERTPEAGGATFTLQRYRVDFPVGSFRPVAGTQVVTIDSSVYDPNLTGRDFRVVSLLHKTRATAYRLGVEETS